MSDTVEVVDKRNDRSTPEYHPYQPILDRIIVRPVAADESADGFIIPKEWRQQTNCGIVVSIGDFTVLGGERVPLSRFVNVGDKVWYGDYSSERFPLDGEDLVVIRLADIRLVARRKNA